MQDKELVQCAIKAREMAYCPYSGYAVGAALLGQDGIIYTGCNVESTSYSPTNCAERTAFFKAISEGCRSFTKIAVVGGYQDPQKADGTPATPCGVCRQVMIEFCSPEQFIILAASADGMVVHRYTLAQLLPAAFAPNNLG